MHSDLLDSQETKQWVKRLAQGENEKLWITYMMKKQKKISQAAKKKSKAVMYQIALHHTAWQFNQQWLHRLSGKAVHLLSFYYKA